MYVCAHLCCVCTGVTRVIMLCMHVCEEGKKYNIFGGVLAFVYLGNFDLVGTQDGFILHSHDG